VDILLALLMLPGVADISGMMGVGCMIQGCDGMNGTPPETFYLTDDSGDILTNDAGTNRITTQ